MSTTADARADMPSLQALVDMYECGMEFIGCENEPDDAPDRDAMAALLDQIEALIAVEANEDMAQYARQVVARGRDNSGGAFRFAVAPITHVDVRDAADSHGFWSMSGYAAVFNQPTTLYDGKLLRLTESIAPKAFDRVLRDQPMAEPDGVVHFNLGHDMNRAVAATDVPAGQAGSLQLRADKHGLFFLAKVAADDPDGVAMASKMRAGVIRQASFAFQIADAKTEYTEAEEGPDVEHRTILEMKHLYDVCATPQGAYAQTVSGLRSLAAALGQPGQPGDPYSRQPILGDEHVASPPRGDDGSPVTPEPDRIAQFAKRTAEVRDLIESRYKPRK
jgi:HK97 family phage prohead protease